MACDSSQRVRASTDRPPWVGLKEPATAPWHPGRAGFLVHDAVASRSFLARDEVLPNPLCEQINCRSLSPRATASINSSAVAYILIDDVLVDVEQKHGWPPLLHQWGTAAPRGFHLFIHAAANTPHALRLSWDSSPLHVRRVCRYGAERPFGTAVPRHGIGTAHGTSERAALANDFACSVPPSREAGAASAAYGAMLCCVDRQ